MNVKIEKMPGSKVEIKVEIESAEFKDYYEEAFKKVLEDAEVKGFRKGKVPVPSICSVSAKGRSFKRRSTAP